MAKIETHVSVDTKEKVYNLYLEWIEAKKDKKAAVKAHSENVKRIEDELEEVLDQEDQEVKKSQKTADDE